MSFLWNALSRFNNFDSVLFIFTPIKSVLEGLFLRLGTSIVLDRAYNKSKKNNTESESKEN